jgi:hypothetical protein
MGLIVMLGFATGSWLGLFRARQLQLMAMERLRRDGESPTFNWALVLAPYYLWMLRLIGLISGIVALYLAYALITVLVGH